LVSENRVSPIPASGIFGSCSSSPDGLKDIVGRLSEPVRRSIVQITATFGETGGDRSVLGSSDAARLTALLSGPFVAPQKAEATGASTPKTAIVSFVGHLAGPVSDLPSENPAEVVRIAYDRWGVECFSRLNGNYAVAIYDPQIRCMLVACDAAGTKPVYYSCTNGLIFGSSAADVLRASGTTTIANPRALLRYLTHGTICGENETLFEGVQSLRGGHYLEMVPGRPLHIHSIDSPNFAPDYSPESFAQSARDLQALLLETVKLQAGGGSVGVALSGGIDSSGIAACLRAAVGPRAPLPAFSFVHGHPSLPDAWNERPWAELAASHVQATLHPVTLQARAIPGAMPEVLRKQEFPFSSPVILAQAEVFRVAADNGVRVMLNGHGPDSLFGGGDAHTVARASQLLRSGRILGAWALLHHASEFAASSTKRLFLASIRQAIPIRRRGNRFSAIPPGTQRSWFAERLEARTEEPVAEPGDPMRRLILDQVYRSVLPTTLHYEERNAVGQGVENRLPYLVGRLLRLAGDLPPEYLVSDTGESKRVLRAALLGLVPGAILNRWNRIGFAVPALPWLHELQPWVDDRLKELRSLPFFLETPISAAWERIRGSDTAAWINAYHIWRWITLLEWAKVHRVEFR